MLGIPMFSLTLIPPVLKHCPLLSRASKDFKNLLSYLTLAHARHWHSGNQSKKQTVVYLFRSTDKLSRVLMLTIAQLPRATKIHTQASERFENLLSLVISICPTLALGQVTKLMRTPAWPISTCLKWVQNESKKLPMLMSFHACVHK